MAKYKQAMLNRIRDKPEPKQESHGIVPFGEYRDMPIEEVPKEYLISLCCNGRFKRNVPHWMIQYIVAHYHDELSWSKPGRICYKLAYATEKVAKQHLAAIRETNSPRKPIRAYECPHCSQFHLTSKPDRDHETEDYE